jgi:hypothetical protein
VAQSGRYFYQPRGTDEFVGELLYRRQGRTETDFDLYRGADPLAMFVVGNVTSMVGPALTNSHTRYTVDEFLALDPRNRRRMASLLQTRLPRAN